MDRSLLGLVALLRRGRIIWTGSWWDRPADLAYDLVLVPADDFEALPRTRKKPATQDRA